MEVISSTFVGILLGVISSIIGWWILFRCYIPNLSFSSIISKIEEDNSRARYRIRILNKGRRKAIDLEIIARLQVRGILKETPKVWKQVNLKIAGEKIPYIEKDEARIIRLLPEKTIDFREMVFPEEIREKAWSEKLTLEDLFRCGEESFLQIHVFAYDEFSGSRKMFLSPKYQFASISSEKFHKQVEYI